MANYLITGYWGEPHVTAENDRGVNAAIFGTGRFVLPVGEQLRAEYIGNNTIRLYDGKLIDNGAVAGIPAGTYIDLLIPEAGQGMNRSDLIIFQYTKDASTLIETGSFLVLHGEETEGIAFDPILTQEDLLTDEAAFDQFALWRVSVSGANISAPAQMFSTTSPKQHAVEAEAAAKIYAESVARTARPYNLLDNSDFSNPVNQRGKSSYTQDNSARVYTIDRWTAGNATVVLDAGFVSYKTNRAEGYKRMQQYIGAPIRAGKYYTYAMLARVKAVGNYLRFRPAQDVVGISGISGIQITNTTPDFELFVYTFKPDIDIVKPSLELLCMNTMDDFADVDIKWIALYEGQYTAETLPEYQPKGFGAELSECQRYFVRMALESTAHIGYAHATSTTAAAGVVALPRDMVAEPTVTKSGTPVLLNGSAAKNVTAVSINHLVGSACYINLTSSGLTAGTIYAIRLPTAGLDFSADL